MKAKKVGGLREKPGRTATGKEAVSGLITTCQAPTALSTEWLGAFLSFCWIFESVDDEPKHHEGVDFIRRVLASTRQSSSRF